MTVTLKIEQQDGTIKDVEVSQDYMDLCNAQANYIVDAIDIKQDSMGKIRDLVEACSSDDNTRSVVANMVMRKLTDRCMMSLLGQALNRLLGE